MKMRGGAGDGDARRAGVVSRVRIADRVRRTKDRAAGRAARALWKANGGSFRSGGTEVPRQAEARATTLGRAARRACLRRIGWAAGSWCTLRKAHGGSFRSGGTEVPWQAGARATTLVRAARRACLRRIGWAAGSWGTLWKANGGSFRSGGTKVLRQAEARATTLVRGRGARVCVALGGPQDHGALSGRPTAGVFDRAGLKSRGRLEPAPRGTEHA